MSTINVKYPVCITSRLRCGVKIGQSEISIAFDDWSEDNRQNYRYWLDLNLDSKRIECYGEDIQSGVGGGTLQFGLESLLSFLQACGESYRYGLQVYGDPIDGEHTGLFPEDVAEWCYINSDELAMLACELEETENAIDESDD